MSPERVHKLGHYVAEKVHNAVGHFGVGIFCLLTGLFQSYGCICRNVFQHNADISTRPAIFQDFALNPPKMRHFEFKADI